MEDELKFHLDMEIEKNLERGLSAQEARRSAMLTFGGMEQVKEDCRDAWGTRMMNDFIRDLRLGLRQANNHRRYAVVVVLTLSLCIGANTAIFSILNNALLKPYSFPEADKLFRVVTDLNEQGHRRTIYDSSIPSYFRYREVETMAESGFYTLTSNVTTIGEIAEQMMGALVTPSFIRVLNLQPLHGRWFYDEEGEDGQHHVVMLSYAFWLSTYNGDTSVIGKTIQLDDEDFEIVGIMPKEFNFDIIPEEFYHIARHAHIWRPYPITVSEKSANPWQQSHIFIVARLKPEATIGQAQANLDSTVTRMVEDYPDQKSFVEANSWRPRFVNYHKDRFENVKTALYMLQGSAWIVLLIGCVNIANLSLTRVIVRLRELSLRVMLGAGIGRISRMLLTESLLYGIMGCALGLILGYLGIELIKIFDLYRYPRGDSLELDRTVLMYTIAASFLCSIIIGLIPLILINKRNLVSTYGGGERTITLGIAAHRIRSLLVVAQVSMTFILLICSGLLIKSLVELLEVDPGFNPNRVLTARMSSADRFDERGNKQYYSELLERLHQVPDVVAAGTNTTMPFTGGGWTTSYHIENYDYQPGEVNQNFATSQVDGRYFKALGLNIIMGRGFEPIVTMR